MLAGDDERRRGDPALHTESGRNPLGHGGLSGPERAVENHQITGDQHVRKPGTELGSVCSSDQFDVHR